MKLDQAIDANEIVSNANLATRLMRAAKTDVAETVAQKASNEHVRMQTALYSGPVMATLTNDRLLAATAKLTGDLMGAFGAATEKVESHIGPQTNVPVLQGNAGVTSSRPGTYKVTAPKLGL